MSVDLPSVVSIRSAVEQTSGSRSNSNLIFQFSLVVTGKFDERPTEVDVADVSVYGAKLTGCGDHWPMWNLGSRFTAKCEVKGNRISGRKIFLKLVKVVADAPVETSVAMMAPPCAVVLSHSMQEVLLIHALTGHAYIHFIYLFQNIVRSYVANAYVLNEEIAAAIGTLEQSIQSNLPYYRTAELETIGALDFIHRHEMPLRGSVRPSDVYRVGALPEVQAIRQLVEAEVAARYAEGRLDGTLTVYS